MLLVCTGFIVPLLVCTGYLTHTERKVIASIQMRSGPAHQGALGGLQALADGLKLFTKETIFPLVAELVVFVAAPVVTFTLALLSWSVLPMGKGKVLADIELGLLFVFALGGLGVYGFIHRD